MLQTITLELKSFDTSPLGEDILNSAQKKKIKEKTKETKLNLHIVQGKAWFLSCVKTTWTCHHSFTLLSIYFTIPRFWLQAGLYSLLHSLQRFVRNNRRRYLNICLLPLIQTNFQLWYHKICSCSRNARKKSFKLRCRVEGWLSLNGNLSLMQSGCSGSK